MNLRLASLVIACGSFAACTSYHSTQVRVLSNQGGGIADARVQFNAERSQEGDSALNGRYTWTTDAAGRATIDYKGGGNGGHWHIDAEGFRPLDVNASPDEIRIKQYGSRSKNHDAEPLMFTLEQNPPNAASDPKQFESGEGKKAFESTVDQPKTGDKKDAPKDEKKKPKFEA